jgi:hypothetical protein
VDAHTLQACDPAPGSAAVKKLNGWAEKEERFLMGRVDAVCRRGKDKKGCCIFEGGGDEAKCRCGVGWAVCMWWYVRAGEYQRGVGRRGA